MRLLLDTHTLLWFLEGSPRLSAAARVAIENPQNTRFVSIVTLWEIAIKINISKLSLNGSFQNYFPAQLQSNLIQVLPVEISHLNFYLILPLHHRDPFDRLLIAQAQAESLTLISADVALDAYPITRLW